MISITQDEAREYLFKYQNLYCPRRLESDEEILTFIRKVGCIQYDPLSMTARNADLVLQSRCRNYSKDTLYRLLYEKRQLLDGWDKCMSIWPVEDWPCFERKRKEFRKAYAEEDGALKPMRKEAISMIKRNGFISSRDIDNGKRIDWSWARTSEARATLESMYHCGKLVVHHREGTRKYYGLSEDLLPSPILNKRDPNRRMDDYNEWYVKRRVGSIGLLRNKASDAWLGCRFKRDDRNRAVKKLLDKEQIVEIQIAGIDEPFYLPQKATGILNDNETANEASLIAPLDNLIWDRKLIVKLFGFDYKWEVYTPVKKRKFGYYVLPIIYRNRFIGRCEPVMDSTNKCLLIKNWWWEKDVCVDQDLKDALSRCFRDFAAFLGAEKIVISKALSRKKIGYLKACTELG